MATAYPMLGRPRMLDRPNRHLTALARETASRAAALIPTGEHMHLGITLRDEGALHIGWWTPEGSACGELCAAPGDFAPASSPEGALQRAGLALLEYLSGRWPSEAVPAMLGIVTDGEGLAFSAALSATPRRHWTPDGYELIAIIPFPGMFCTHSGNSTVH